MRSRPSANLHAPISHTFHRLRTLLAESFPELLETLNGPVDLSLLESFERELGCQLPPAVRDSFVLADGQDIDSGCSGLFFGLYLLPLEDVMREWAFWRQAEHDPAAGKNPAVLATMASVPPSWIKQLYACRGWIPLLSDRTGNYVGVDLDPGPGGSWGQVIVFGRDFDRKCVLWKGDGEGGWGKWLSAFVDELESGEGWEADKSTSSDEDEEVGYGSYNGGAQYGESGKGLRLAGEYKGWNVLEAWWDRSVRQWEQMNMGLDVEEIERGLGEARRLAGLMAEVEEAKMGNTRASESSTQAERTGERFAGLAMSDNHAEAVSAMGSPIPQPPSTPVPRDSDSLLPPSSPETFAARPPKMKQKIPVRVITPIAEVSDHPLQAGPSTSNTDHSGYLSPPDRRRTRAPPPAPSPLDLPTRADVQAMAAIAQAENSGLRGGWVMSMDPGINARRQRNGDSDMVDIDLEGGKGEKFGSPRVSAEEMERLREEEKLSLAGIEQRSPRLLHSRTPSPLARNDSFEAPPHGPNGIGIGTPQSGFVSAGNLQRPQPAANNSDVTVRKHSIPEEYRDHAVLRSSSLAGGPGPMQRTQRESSVFSECSNDGLLDVRSVPSRSQSPVHSEPAADSPVTITQRRSIEDRTEELDDRGLGGLEDEMEDVNLDDGENGRRHAPQAGGLREVTA